MTGWGMADPLAAFQCLDSPDPAAVADLARVRPISPHASPVTDPPRTQLLLDDDLSIVWGLLLSATSKDLESLASTILKFFDAHEREVFLIEQAITKEVQLTSKRPQTSDSQRVFSALYCR